MIATPADSPIKTEHDCVPEVAAARGASPAPVSELPLVDPGRGAGVAIGPSLLLDLIAVAGTAAVTTGSVFRPKTGTGRLLRPLAALGAIAPWAYLLGIRPWHRRWGATDEEIAHGPARRRAGARAGLPAHSGGHPGRPPTTSGAGWCRSARAGAASTATTGSRTWPAGDIHSADRVHPEWQDVRPGDPLAIMRGWGRSVAARRAGRALVIAGWGTYVVRPIDADTSRLDRPGAAAEGLADARLPADPGDPALRHGAQDAARHQGARRASGRRPVAARPGAAATTTIGAASPSSSTRRLPRSSARCAGHAGGDAARLRAGDDPLLARAAHRADEASSRTS